MVDDVLDEELVLLGVVLLEPSSPVGNRSEPPPPVCAAEVVVAGLVEDEVRSEMALVEVLPGPVAKVEETPRPEQVAPVLQQPVERQ